ncbi:hypothetical protein JKF63_03272 [Porcisia hertigi]|uniref:Uncharacterized protein n=1 Tax=Porcisia hertigi TaxID=2761500 RepID=A0A836I1X4_9TRYP|nr:hypothetical protein JKF63_03257 [Porcisia hertigi]KAG5501444.1 hypothetical protein JKF63_03258 [Porcisia hertigi]KAG5501445.1 hypothetical protein JKF63_03260 [Porcisia hertigi]KAG5501446.1 hypothetical protein JKF63_03272 [Porcisia hertigi]
MNTIHIVSCQSEHCMRSQHFSTQLTLTLCCRVGCDEVGVHPREGREFILTCLAPVFTLISDRTRPKVQERIGLSGGMWWLVALQCRVVYAGVCTPAST